MGNKGLHMKLSKFNSLKINKELTLKIINILSLVFAIVAIALSYLLSTKRAELFKSNNEMASAINKTSSILDKNSGTKISGKISAETLKESYKNPTALQVFQKQANSIVSQKNDLGTAMEKIAKIVPGATSLTSANFTNTASYKQSIESLLKSSNEYTKRRLSLLKNITDLSGILDIKIKNESELRNAPTIKGYQAAFKQLIEAASSINKNNESEKNEIASVKNELGKLHIELNKYIDLDSDYKVLLNEKKSQNLELSQKTKSLSGQIKDYKNRLEALNAKKTTPLISSQRDSQKVIAKDTLLGELHGKVLKFDKKWGNVIIDLGKNNKIQVNERTITVPVPINSELIVARNDKFVARIKIEQVFDNYSLAAITFPLNEELKPGDIVFFPSK